MGAAISERPELLTKMDPVLREFFLFLCRRGVISSFHTQMRSYLSSLKQVGVLGHLIPMTSSFSELLSFHVSKQIKRFPWLPLLWSCLVFQKNYIRRHNSYGPSKTWNPRIGNPRIGCYVLEGWVTLLKTRLDYTNVYRTHNSHLWANGDVSNGMRSVSWQGRGVRGRRNICVAGAAFILRDVAESDEKENEGRPNAGAKASFRWASGNGHFVHFSATFHLLGCFNLSWMKLDGPLNRHNFLWNLGRSSKLVTWRLRQKSSNMN